MDVVFEPRRGRPFCIEIGFFDTILEIKEKIQKYHLIPIDEQTLIFHGRVLEDDLDVGSCEILHNSHIQLRIASEIETSSDVNSDDSPSPPKRIHLNIKIPATQTQFPVEMDVNDSIGRLKNRIHEMEALIPVKRLILQSSGGSELQDDRSLLDYELSDNSEIEVSLRPLPPVSVSVSVSAPTSGITAASTMVTTTGPSTKKLRVMVKTHCGNKKIPMEVNASDTVGELKKHLQKQEQRLHLHLPQEDFFFIYDQGVMEEDRSFRWHRVNQGATIEIFEGTVTGGS